MKKNIKITKVLEKERRGDFLITVLILYLLFIIFNTGASFVADLFDTQSLLLIKEEHFIILLLHIAIFIGLLKWKKIAVYGFFLLPVLQILFVHTILFPRTTYFLNFLDTFTVISFLYIPLSIYFFAFKKKWHLFN